MNERETLNDLIANPTKYIPKCALESDTDPVTGETEDYLNEELALSQMFADETLCPCYENRPSETHMGFGVLLNDAFLAQAQT